MYQPDWYEAFEEASRQVEEVCTLLDSALDLLDDMKGYVPEYFREKWNYDADILDIKKQLRDLNI